MRRWQVSRGRLTAFALVMAVAAPAALAPHSIAIVPPTDCGAMTVKAERYTSKTDQLRCLTSPLAPRRAGCRLTETLGIFRLTANAYRNRSSIR